MNIQINLVHKEPQRLVPLLQGRPEPEMELVLKPKKTDGQQPCAPNQGKPELEAPALMPNPPNEASPA
jgi:hypothetical protein